VQISQLRGKKVLKYVIFFNIRLLKTLFSPLAGDFTARVNSLRVTGIMLILQAQRLTLIHHMKKNLLLTTLAFAFAASSFAQRNLKSYEYSMDLNKVVDDKLTVNLFTPAIDKEEITFFMPKIVPGTYEIYNFGRFVSNFHAFDKDGKELPVTKTDTNSWLIKTAKKLDHLNYEVEDTWDTKIKEKFVFEPGGTNIEAGKNFMLNTHGFFGYFEGMKFSPFVLHITHPQGFYGATALIGTVKDAATDEFNVESYVRLADSPIMYSMPDTGMIDIGGSKVLVSVYSPNKKVTGKFVASKIKQMLDAQAKYLGGKLPVEKYAFLVYLTDHEGGSGASGALEHSYSSMYFLPEMSPDDIVQTIRDVASHEFFHIVTPLSIHAEQIGNFDFQEGKMSEHLWMYEGVTEYSASHMQVKYGLITMEEYLSKIREKMYACEQFKDDLPFTTMSKGCLDEYNSQYGNVYQKGALIGLCLDIKLRVLSDGKYGIQDLMKDLAKTYGKDRSFKDEELFDEITRLTYPEIGEFLKKCVSGKDPLPFKEVFNAVGIDYIDKVAAEGFSFGGVSIGYNPGTGRLVVLGTEKMDDFGKELGYMENDELVKFNGKKLTLDNAKEVIGKYLSSAKAGKNLKVEVMRVQPDGKVKKVKLKAKIHLVDVSQKYFLKPSPTASEKQLRIRKAWMGPME
jgi:predicted metalloprotease with PDZ domain